VVDKVSVVYGAAVALHALSLSVEQGEFFCLLGPSGCGKTTLLNVIAGFVPLTGGQVLIGGEDVTRLAPQKRRIGMVFQSYALYPHMTAAQNIAYGLKIRRRPATEIAKRVAEMLSLVRLAGKGERYPRQLSGGEQQRVAIARALAIEPRLLLLDEPLSNLDAKLRDEMRAELKRIQRAAGVTTVFVTHDQSEALGIGDRIAVLNAGHVEQVGSPREIYRVPRTAFVAHFIGRSNTLRGRPVRIDGRSALSVNGQVFAVAAPLEEADSAAIYLRPEELSVARERSEGNCVAGTVIDSIYGGALVIYRVRTAVAELEVCQLGHAGDVIPPGTDVFVSWLPEAGYIGPPSHDG
jgi:putative spermidine/putrescine transport system ATP-binding protein